MLISILGQAPGRYYMPIRFCIRIICLLLLINSFFTVANASDDYQQGAYYFSRGDYISALTMWTPLAEQGNPTAQYSIGLLYEQGKGVGKDPVRALTYFQTASDQGLPAAQYYLAMKYYMGLNLKKNIIKARQLMIQAAEHDYLQAQFQLAAFYAEGKGGTQDQKQATYWLTKASESGYGPAQHSLAARFLTGNGTTIDLQRGIFWLTKAAEQQDSDAMRDLGFMYFQGMGVSKDYQQAHDLLLIPAEEGSGLALFLLGEIYSTGGYGINKDLSQAKKWFQQAQRSGYKEAQQRLQQLHNRLDDVDQKKKGKTTSHTRLANDAQRFKQLDNSYYVLQLLSGKNYLSITRLMAQYSDEQTYLLKMKKKDKDVFILTSGYYKTYDEAKKSISKLRKIFQLKSTPWIRQVNSVKPLISDDF